MINEYKSEINILLKIFLNSFDKNEKVENNFSNSLQKYLNNFTKEYYNNYNKNFKNLLEEKLNIIINKYNNDTSIEKMIFYCNWSSWCWKKYINKSIINFRRKSTINRILW